MDFGLRPLVLRWSLGPALVAAAATACYTGPTANDGFLPVPPPERPTTDTNGTEPLADGLPCDVAQVLHDNCTSCHGQTPQVGATVTLLTRDDLMADFKGKVVAALSVERMRADVKFMPPDGALPDDQIAILEQWIAQGMPAGSCGDIPDDDAGAPPVKTTCTSGTHWTRGDHGSALMKPGAACIHCHATGSEDDDDDEEAQTRDRGPTLSFAGTVFPSAHDEEDCNGVDGTATGTKVTLTGADGQVVTLPINAAGNFYTQTKLAVPVIARVVNAAGTRRMQSPVQDGDCNKCHTATSASPGRIIAKQ